MAKASGVVDVREPAPLILPRTRRRGEFRSWIRLALAGRIHQFLENGLRLLALAELPLRERLVVTLDTAVGNEASPEPASARATTPTAASGLERRNCFLATTSAPAPNRPDLGSGTDQIGEFSRVRLRRADRRASCPESIGQPESPPTPRRTAGLAA